MNELCVKFLNSFIEILTMKKDTCFFAITDLDYEFLEIVSGEVNVNGVCIQQVSRKDFGPAIKLRNNMKVKKIVLLSSESIKRMESLKDFIEVNILDDMELFFNAVYKTFEITHKYNSKALIEKYVKTIISEQKNSLVEFLKYFEACKKGSFFNDCNINKNLHMLGIWSLNSKDTGIVKLRRAIRFSDNSNFEKMVQLIEDNSENTFTSKEKRALLKAITTGDFSSAFNVISFEKIEKFIKSNRISSHKRTHKKTKVTDADKNTMEKYFFSYEYLLDNNLDDIDNIEQLIYNDFELEVPELESFSYAIETIRNVEISNEIINRNLEDFRRKLLSSNISEIKREEIENSLQGIVELYKTAEKTPVTLKSFCEESFNYCQSYFELMCKFILDEDISAACYMNDIIESFLLIFSKNDKKGIRISFRHPISVFYFFTIKTVFEQAMVVNKRLNEKYEYTLNGLIERLIYKFPIEIIKFKSRHCYYNNNVQYIPFEIVFEENSIGISQAKVGFKSISKYLVKYITTRECYSPEIKVCIIGDILPQSFGYLLKCISDDEPFKEIIFEFEFVCSNEELIKNAIEESLENQSLIKNSTFKFTGYKYSSGIQNNFDIGNFIKNNDITFISNSSILYNDGYFQKCSKNYKFILDFMSTFNLEYSIKSNICHNLNFPKYIIDTLQARVSNSESGIYVWQNNSLNNNTLSSIISETKNDTLKSAVLFSSDLGINKRIYNGLFEPEIFEERGNKYLGVYFNGNIKNKMLDIKKTNSIEFSYMHLIQSIIMESEVNSTIKKIFSQESINYKEAKLKIDITNKVPNISVILLDNSEEKYVETEGELFLNFLKEIWELDDNIISKKLREVIIDLLQGYCTSYYHCLLVKFVESCSKLEISERVTVESAEINRENYVAATKEVFDLLDYINLKQAIDEHSLSHIRKNFQHDVVKNLCESIKSYEFVDVNLREKGIEILRKLES